RTAPARAAASRRIASALSGSMAKPNAPVPMAGTAHPTSVMAAVSAAIALAVSTGRDAGAVPAAGLSPDMTASSAHGGAPRAHASRAGSAAGVPGRQP